MACLCLYYAAISLPQQPSDFLVLRMVLGFKEHFESCDYKCVPGDVSTLDSHADKIPVGGTVSAEVAGDVAYMNYNWETQGSGELLMMALPHHLDTLVSTQTNHKLQALKGQMVGISGDLWEFHEPLTTISWGAPR